MKLLLVVLLAGVAGCASMDKTLVNAEGQQTQCSHAGFGWIGAPVAVAMQLDCEAKAEARGFK